MSKIFEILQEERERILNLHEDRTKSHYLNVVSEDVEQLQSRAKACGWTNYSSESGVSSADVEGYKNSGWECPKGSGKKPNPKQPKDTTTTTKPPAQQITTPEKQVSTQPTLNKTTVMNIQNSLKGKGVNLGTSGPKKDGVDGVLGNVTLNAIEKILGTTQQPASPVQPQQPTQTLPTLPAGTVQRPTQPTQLAGQKK